MAEQDQSFASHRRFVPIWHFVAFPILAINVPVALYGLYRDGISFATVWGALVAVALVLGLFAGRTMAIINQDRLIRLEERLRLEKLLPEELAASIGKLTVSQLVGLRFAADGEVAGLVKRCLDGELAGREEVKKQIQQWRADHLRV